jgi:nicotinamide riboside kinase
MRTSRGQGPLVDVYVIGPQSTGKTTLVTALRAKLGKDTPVIEEVARTVMRERGYSREDVDSADINRKFSMQRDIFKEQMRQEISFQRDKIRFLSDRCAIDPLVYLMHYSGKEVVQRITMTDEWRRLRNRYRDPKRSLVILLLPVDEFLTDDNVRYVAKTLEDWYSLAESFRRFMLEENILFIEIGKECVNLEERVQQIVDILRKLDEDRRDQRIFSCTVS